MSVNTFLARVYGISARIDSAYGVSNVPAIGTIETFIMLTYQVKVRFVHLRVGANKWVIHTISVKPTVFIVEVQGNNISVSRFYK